jgi:hypothetical protein
MTESAQSDCRVDAALVSGQHDTVSSYHNSSPDLEIPEVEVGRIPAARHFMHGRFLKGPIMMRDIAVAARLPGQALVVMLAVRHRRDLTGQAEVTLPKALMIELGVSRDAKARALLQLENAGLITVARQKGRAARVRLIT